MKIPSPDKRREILIARRNKKMALSPHAYMRGNTVSVVSHYHMDLPFGFVATATLATLARWPTLLERWICKYVTLIRRLLAILRMISYGSPCHSPPPRVAQTCPV